MSNLELPNRSLPVLLIEASICVALNITSIIGNSLVCMAAYRNPNMPSTTNLYIIALAVSDLLCATIEMPLVSTTLIIGRWDFGDAVCQMQGFIDVFSTYATPATLGLTAINRYVKIVKTNHYKKYFSPLRSKIWLCCVWIFLLLYLLTGWATNLLSFEFVPGFEVCALGFANMRVRIVHFCMMFGLFFTVPLCSGICSATTRYYPLPINIKWTQLHRSVTGLIVEEAVHWRRYMLLESCCTWPLDFCVAGYQCGHSSFGSVFLQKPVLEKQQISLLFFFF